MSVSNSCTAFEGFIGLDILALRTSTKRFGHINGRDLSLLTYLIHVYKVVYSMYDKYIVK